MANQTIGFIDKRRNRVDLTGKVFNRLTAIRRVGTSSSRSAIWRFACECGSEIDVIGTRVVKGRTKSCGCLVTEQLVKNGARLGKSNATHGATHTKEYQAWSSMKARCMREDHGSYHSYGGRGITVCDRWASSFEAFLEDMGRAPSKEHSLDRIENDKGYSPENCRWATRDVQVSNTRSNKYVMIHGEKLTITQASRKYGKSKLSAIRERIWGGMDPVTAILTPPMRARR